MSGGSEVRRLAAQRYWREEQARVAVDAWERSGMSLAAFARRYGIVRQRLERWAQRLGAASVGRVRFHRVRLIEHGRDGEAPVAGVPIEIEWGSGRRVRVYPGFAAEDLGRVLDALEGRQGC